MKKLKTLMAVSVCLSTLMAVIFCISNVCTMFERCPKCAVKCEKSQKCRPYMKKGYHGKFKMEHGKRNFRHHNFRNKGQNDCRKQNFCSKNQQFCPQAKMNNKNNKFHKQNFRKNNAAQVRRPKFKMSEEQKANMKEFFAAVKAYKKEQTPENKAKLTALLGKNFDKRIAMQEKHAAAMKKNAAALEKKTADMKANRDAEIEKMLQNIINPKKRQFRRKFQKTGKPMPAAKAPTAAAN